MNVKAKVKLLAAIGLSFSLSIPIYTATAAPKGFTDCTSSNSSLNKKLPTTFQEAISKRKCIPFAALQRMGAKKESITALVQVEVLIGPNTKPWFNKVPAALQSVLQLFPNSSQPQMSYFIYYNFKDAAWAKKKLQSLVSPNEYENFLRNENGRVTESNCEEVRKDCFGSKALTAGSGTGFVLLGVPNALNNGDPVADYRFKAGMLEAHEFFHLLQDIPLVGKGLEPLDWPPGWVTEGGAEYIQNGAINKGSFKKYLDFRSRDSSNLYQMKWLYTEKYLAEYLRQSITENRGSQYNSWLSYNLGSRFIEVLVAIKGQESLLQLNYELSTKIGFKQAFEKVYGISWNKAVPILAKVVAKDLTETS
ncbi:MAG: hypothetical protein F2602_03220 [Actinobacteria bacterium]|uniref:Unannotated protein n=1 Tax=freshwater metagenome TaxID=449393 RepID=A0A6J6C2C1_9ZZZZ|nr:hypothetical protein [Actinomycetota bacterium]MTA21412.1 hypothetical protein [Actinomycetota bacterium]